MKYWELIADRLSKAGWSLGAVFSAVDCDGRTRIGGGCGSSATTGSFEDFCEPLCIISGLVTCQQDTDS
jgi:hypothetical protein